MEPIKEIGEFKITVADGPLSGEEFFFKPSFENIMKIGNPREIVEAFAILNGSEINAILQRATESFGSKIPDAVWKLIISKPIEWRVIKCAMNVMESCCYSDAAPLIGYFKGWKYPAINYKPGLMPINMIVANAKNLLEHGIIGKANLRVPARDEQGFSTEFNAAEYITSARVNFNMPVSEARQLSMTELHMLIKQKFPQKKGLTRDEINQLTAQYELERDQALGVKPKTHEWKKITLADLQNRGKKQ